VFLPLVVAAPAPPAPIVHAVRIQDSPIALSIATRAGTKRIVCAIDRRSAKTCTHSPTFKASPGRHTIVVRAVDRRGRISARRAVAVVVPARAPAAVKVGGEPVGIAAANGTVWVSGGSSGAVIGIDAATKKVVATVQVGGQLGGIAATGDAVWVSVFGGGSVVRIDPATHAIVRRVAVGGRPTGIAIDGTGTVWVGNLDGYLSLIVPSTPGFARVTAPSGVSQPLFARGLMWAGLQSGSLASLDPASSSLTGKPVPVGQDVDALVDTPSGVWVSTFAGQAALVDPDARKVVRRFTLPSSGSGISYANGSVWVSVFNSKLVVRLDAATGALLGAVHTGGQPRESVVAGNLLWVADQADGTVTPIAL
jgi:streptogramin lyase